MSGPNDSDSLPMEGPVDELDIAAWDLGRAHGTEDFADACTTFLCFVTTRARAARRVRPHARARTGANPPNRLRVQYGLVTMAGVHGAAVEAIARRRGS